MCIYRCYLAARSPDIIAWHHHGLPTMAASKAQFKQRHPAMVSTFHTYPYMLVIAPFLTFPLFSFMKNPSFIDKESTPWKGRASRPVGAKGMFTRKPIRPRVGRLNWFSLVESVRGSGFRFAYDPVKFYEWKKIYVKSPHGKYGWCWPGL